MSDIIEDVSVEPMDYTCSMAEIGGLVTTHINKISGKEFIDKLGSIDYSSLLSEIKALIYNSCGVSRSFNNHMLRLGFKPVFKYRGNSGNKVVTTWMGTVEHIEKQTKK